MSSLFCSRKRLLADRGGAIVGPEEVAIDVERDRRRAMAKAPGDRQHVEALRDVNRIRMEAFEKVIDEARAEPPSSREALD